jgi:hypothetical protein
MALSFQVSGPLGSLSINPLAAFGLSFPSDGVGTSVSFTALDKNGTLKASKGAVTEAGSGYKMLGTCNLFLPQNMETQFTANYEETEMSQILRNGIENGIMSEGTGNAVISGAVDNAINAAGEFTGLAGAGAAAAIERGKVRNNHMEVMFRGMAFRQFSFNWKFFPRNSGEVGQIRSAINFFKVNMHPEFENGEDKVYFLPPPVFNISVRNGSGFYGGYKDSALIDMSVNFTGGGQATEFTNGAPTEIDLSLTFKELEYNTRDDVFAGRV